jgi:hypothetical protein
MDFSIVKNILPVKQLAKALPVALNVGELIVSFKSGYWCIKNVECVRFYWQAISANLTEMLKTSESEFLNRFY